MPARPLAARGAEGWGERENVVLEREPLNLEFEELELKPGGAGPWTLRVQTLSVT